MADKSLTRKRSLILGDTPEEKLWFGVSKEPGQGPKGECWEWQYSKRGSGNRVGGGYGTFTIGTKRFGTHCVAYELTNGSIPEGMRVLHSCDNPPCCRPDHLKLGTDQDNVREAFERGRRGIGETHWTRYKPERIARGDNQHSAR